MYILPQGYVPVKKLDFNIMASRGMLDKIYFSESDIEKMQTVLNARNKALKSSKNIVKSLKKTIEGKGKEKPIFPGKFICDVCNGDVGIGIAKLTSQEQCSTCPTDWALVRFDIDRIYAVIYPGIVVDYTKKKTYSICGNCQIIAQLKATESGLLANEIKDDQGYIDLEKLYRLIDI